MILPMVPYGGRTVGGTSEDRHARVGPAGLGAAIALSRWYLAASASATELA